MPPEEILSNDINESLNNDEGGVNETVDNDNEETDERDNIESDNEADVKLEDESGEDKSETVDNSEGDVAESNHVYNLRNRGSINYKNMHRFGEVQLMQLQKEWIREKTKIHELNECKSTNHLNIKANDLFRRTIGIALTQLSKEDRYAQVSVREGIKRHGHKAIATAVGPVEIP